MRLAYSFSSSSAPEDMIGNAAKMQKMSSTLVSGIKDIPITDVFTNPTQDPPNNIVMVSTSHDMSVLGSDQSVLYGEDPLLPSQKRRCPWILIWMILMTMMMEMIMISLCKEVRQDLPNW